MVVVSDSANLFENSHAGVTPHRAPPDDLCDSSVNRWMIGSYLNRGANHPFSETRAFLVDAGFAADLENWAKLTQIEPLLRLRIRGPLYRTRVLGRIVQFLPRILPLLSA